MTGPLVSRPPYGEGKRAPLAVAELPEGSPAGKGVSLDPGIPGQSTFNKPVDDVHKPENKDESIYRVESPDDMTKDQTVPDEIDHSKAKPSYNGLGKPLPGEGKTKYPYRDEAPNAHNASFLVEQMKLEGAPVRVIAASEPYSVYELAKLASTGAQVLNGLDPKFLERSKACSADLKRADIKNLRWIFTVNCGNGPKAVKVRAIPKGRNLSFAKLDLELSCSCKAWQWLGPEFHAKADNYQLGNPVGTASTPDIRDPERDNRVCKHVAAALSLTKSWAIPEAKIQRAVKKADLLRRVVKRAMSKHAVNVEAARAAVTTGWRIAYDDAPGGPIVMYVKASGDPDGKARLRLHKEGRSEPSKTIPTNDLAGALGRLNVAWANVPQKVQAWLREM